LGTSGGGYGNAGDDFTFGVISAEWRVKIKEAPFRKALECE